jgi:ABC-2 type transport system permease protein
MAALGGAMMPLEFFSPTMRVVAHFTPHAWAVDGFTELVRHGEGIADIAVPLAVLLGAAMILLALASWRLRRSITR